jgi:hypothetical protein
LSDMDEKDIPYSPLEKVVMQWFYGVGIPVPTSYIFWFLAKLYLIYYNI